MVTGVRTEGATCQLLLGLFCENSNSSTGFSEDTSLSFSPSLSSSPPSCPGDSCLLIGRTRGGPRGQHCFMNTDVTVQVTKRWAEATGWAVCKSGYPRCGLASVCLRTDTHSLVFLFLLSSSLPLLSQTRPSQCTSEPNTIKKETALSPGRSPCRGKGVSDMPCLLTKEEKVNAHPLPRTLVAAWPPS